MMKKKMKGSKSDNHSKDIMKKMSKIYSFTTYIAYVCAAKYKILITMCTNICYNLCLIRKEVRKGKTVKKDKTQNKMVNVSMKIILINLNHAITATALIETVLSKQLIDMH